MKAVVEDEVQEPATNVDNNPTTSALMKKGGAS